MHYLFDSIMSLIHTRAFSAIVSLYSIMKVSLRNYTAETLLTHAKCVVHSNFVNHHDRLR